ncbi:unnamed protein product [Phytophthora lilii]|uniref:Unnamed protein product n=1 Tax=Phytophthora lilii TaxID=2077276 RepID=A0A9W6WKN5_9STRA|nr:unnamed protein product [Phytophthora lilii]
MFSIVRSNTVYAGWPESHPICRNLITLGGVPRWVVEYLTSVSAARGKADSVSADVIAGCFNVIWKKYVASYLNVLAIEQRARLVVTAIVGEVISPSDTFDGETKWSTLRDNSLCLLT